MIHGASRARTAPTGRAGTGGRVIESTSTGHVRCGARRARARFEALRLSGAVRGIIITYGVGLYSFLMGQAGAPPPASGQKPGGGFLSMILLAVGLQGAVLALRWGVKRYERSHGPDESMAPVATLLSELVVDAVTVAVFAIGTFRGLAQMAGIAD